MADFSSNTFHLEHFSPRTLFTSNTFHLDTPNSTAGVSIRWTLRFPRAPARSVSLALLVFLLFLAAGCRDEEAARNLDWQALLAAHPPRHRTAILVLARAELTGLVDRLNGQYRLAAELQYGGGLRPSDAQATVEMR